MDQEISTLKRLLEKNSPILFLGAGFSVGAKLGNGRSFPKGEELKEIVIKDYLKISDTEDEFLEINRYSLSKVCQYAKNVTSDIRLNDFLSNLLRNSRPDSFHYSITKYNWRKIYTTNIDDLVESIYRERNTDLLLQNFSRKSTVNKSCTEYIKLHGCVNNPSEGIVFSTDEYVDSIVNIKDYRFNSLTLDINSEDFIFLGSEFDEINIDYYLKLYESSGYKSSKGKLIFVNPNPTLFLRSKIRKIGAHLICWNTAEFLDFIDTISKKPGGIDTGNVSLSKVGFQLVKKEIDSEDSKNYDSNLYLGYDPKWKDVFYEWDFINKELLDDFHSFLEKSLEKRKVGIYSLFGKAFSGKSVFLKRIGIELLNRDFEVYSFSGRHFNYYPLYKYISESESSSFALIFDDSSYNYKAIKQFSKLNYGRKNLVIVTTSRPFYHFRKRYHFIDEYYKEFSIDTVITDRYARVIVDKLEEKGYLGELKKELNLEKRIERVKNQNDIFSLLSFITQGVGFKERMLKEIVPKVKHDTLVNDLLLKTAIFEVLDLPYFPRELISFIYSEKSVHLLSIADDFLKFNEKGDVQFRAKFYAKKLLSINGKSRIIDSISEILMFLAPQIPGSSQITNNSYWGEILESLTKQRLLKNVFQLNSKDIKGLLISLRGYYNENSHYWLQLGIAEQSLNEYEKALNHFRQAEALKPNSYIIKHAIGRNYMKHANFVDTRVLAENYHDQGSKILIPLIENEDEYSARAFSTHSYLNEELIFIDKYKINISNHKLKKLFSYLKKIIEKDPDDVMAKHMSNHFYNFLRKTNKMNVIHLNFNDLSSFRSFFADYNTNIDELLDDLY